MGVNSRMAATARSRGTSEDASLPKQGAVSHCLLSLPSLCPSAGVRSTPARPRGSVGPERSAREGKAEAEGLKTSHTRAANRDPARR